MHISCSSSGLNEAAAPKKKTISPRLHPACAIEKGKGYAFGIHDGEARFSSRFRATG